MREVVFDTETTGTRTDLGHRIVELGAVEIIDGTIGDTIQFYFNPERDVDVGAYEVHGLSDEFLSKQSLFGEKLAEIVEFFGSDPLIAHNAKFDLTFLNNELKICDYPAYPSARFVDTLKMSRQRYKSGRHSLDALCARMGVENNDRVLHGALKDSILLAQAYLKMTEGDQHAMQLEVKPMVKTQQRGYSETVQANFSARHVAPVTTNVSVQSAHNAFIQEELKNALWLQ